jgi:hypothetical protein
MQEVWCPRDTNYGVLNEQTLKVYQNQKDIEVFLARSLKVFQV